jgi:response regulator NasT
MNCPFLPTILLVEDDRLILHTLASGLRDAGYGVLEADSAECAVQICLESRPDLALLDMRLPGMLGADFAVWLKNSLDIPFLFLSAYGDSETVKRASEVGALGYLVKPLDISQILPSITTALLRGQEIRKLRLAEVNLCTALKTSRSISMAVGLCMEKYGIGADASFEVLRAYCRSSRTRIPDVAEQIVMGAPGIDLSPYLENR